MNDTSDMQRRLERKSAFRIRFLFLLKIQQNYMTEAAKNEKTNIQHTACDMHDYVYCADNGKCHEDLH